jgi:uncharacterized membrane protein YkoI
MFRFFSLGGFACAAVLISLVLAGSAVSQGYPADTCLPRREAIAAVAEGRAMPLRQVRGTAEQAAHGEMINAELCLKSGQLVYVVTVLSTTGKVVYVSLSAASGQVIGTR